MILVMADDGGIVNGDDGDGDGHDDSGCGYDGMFEVKSWWGENEFGDEVVMIIIVIELLWCWN